MGIELHLDIFPDRIQPEAWKAVYQETLTTLQHFPFMDTVRGKDGMHYAARSEHRENLFEEYAGWRSIGDMITGANTEEFRFFEDIHYYRNCWYRDNGRDILTKFAEADEMDDIPEPAAVLSGKTQGRYSHKGLLAIACLVCHRFPDAAIVSGNITDGQCQEAVEWINQFLENPIDVPCTADKSRLLPRVLSEGMSLETFYRITLEPKDADMGAFLKDHLTKDQINSHYSKELLYQSREDGGWKIDWRTMNEYLEMGFDFRELCRMVLTDPEKSVPPETLIGRLLNAKLHIRIEDKNLYDLSTPRDQMGDRRKTDSVDGQLLRVLLMMKGMENKNVNAYMPIEQIRSGMREVVGENGFDEMFDAVVSGYSGPDQNSAQVQLYDDPNSKYTESNAKAEQEANADAGEYDIENSYMAIEYKPGMTMHPEIFDAFKKHLATIITFGDVRFPYFSKLEKSSDRVAALRDWLPVLVTEEVMDMLEAHIMDDDFMYPYICLLSIQMTDFTKSLVRCFLWNRDLLLYFLSIVEKDREENC